MINRHISIYKSFEKSFSLNNMNGYPDKYSVVDTLKSHGCPSDYNFRKDLYESHYGGNYRGSPEQNTRMNRDLQRGFAFFGC